MDKEVWAALEMKNNIVTLSCITTLDIPAERILKAAEEPLTDGDVIIIGYKPDGEFYFTSSVASGGDVLWLLEKARLELMEVEHDSRPPKQRQFLSTTAAFRAVFHGRNKEWLRKKAWNE